MVTRWSGERIGRLSLRLDAAYCALLGAGVALAGPTIAASLPLPAWAVVTSGVAVVLWAGVVLLVLGALPLRTALRLVMSANLLAAGAVAAVSVTGATVLALLATLAVAVDIGLFAGSQAFALHRMRHVPLARSPVVAP